MILAPSVRLDPLPELGDVLVEGPALGEVVSPQQALKIAFGRGPALAVVEEPQDPHVPQAEVDRAAAPERRSSSGRTRGPPG